MRVCASYGAIKYAKRMSQVFENLKFYWHVKLIKKMFFSLKNLFIALFGHLQS